MTAEQLLKRAAACLTCGREHAYRQIAPDQWTWAAIDGHSYRSTVNLGAIATLRTLAGA